MSTTPWNETPEAQAILASLSEKPPAQREVRDYNPHNRGMIDRMVFADQRCDRLEAIRQEQGKALLAESDRTGDDAAFIAWCEFTVADAIEQAAVRRELAA